MTIIIVFQKVAPFKRCKREESINPRVTPLLHTSLTVVVDHIELQNISFVQLQVS